VDYAAARTEAFQVSGNEEKESQKRGGVGHGIGEGRGKLGMGGNREKVLAKKAAFKPIN